MKSWQRWLDEDLVSADAPLEERVALLERQNRAMRKALRSVIRALVASGGLTPESTTAGQTCGRCKAEGAVDDSGLCSACREEIAALPVRGGPPAPTGPGLRLLCRECETLTAARELEDGLCAACAGIVTEGRYR